MTCIVGYIDDTNGIWMGSDSGSSVGGHIIDAGTKIFTKSNRWIYAFTGSLRVDQLIKYKFDEPKIPEDKDLEEYMVVDYIDSLRECLHKHNWLRRKDNQDDGECRFIIGIRNRLFEVYSDLQVRETSYNYSAMGSGRDFALGSLHSDSRTDPHDKVYRAVQAACEFCTTVCPPIHIEYMGR